MLRSIRCVGIARVNPRLAAPVRRAFSSRTDELGEVPVLDLTPLRQGGEPPQKLVDEMARACEGWGFFQVPTASNLLEEGFSFLI